MRDDRFAGASVLVLSPPDGGVRRFAAADGGGRRGVEALNFGGARAEDEVDGLVAGTRVVG